jgi:lipid-A-disaccharide synthase-like uncharacterized protein
MTSAEFLFGRRAVCLRSTIVRFDKVPTRFWVMILLGVLLAGPVTVYAFLAGGPVAGAIALLAIAFYFVVLWIIIVRRFT